jgi:predicted amidophosphoribosyltransferase
LETRKSGFSSFFDRLVRAVTNPIVNLVYPRVCLGCGSRTPDDAFVCENCRIDELEPLPLRKSDSVSGVLLPQGMLFQDAVWQFHKKQLVQELIHQIKYGGQPGLAVELGEILASRLLQSVEIPNSVVLVPVPLHPKRLKKRGYNQAERIAAGVAKVTGWPVLPDTAVIRTKNTRTQTGFSLDMRQNCVIKVLNMNWQL